MILFEPSEMTNQKLDKIIRQLGTVLQREVGFWQFKFAELVLMCLTDEVHDRLRIISFVTNEDKVASDELVQCMSANFDRALDARYCLSEGKLWAAFIHPLGSLDEEQFVSGCYQVSELVKNFGGSFASGALSFNSGLVD